MDDNRREFLPGDLIQAALPWSRRYTRCSKNQFILLLKAGRLSTRSCSCVSTARSGIKATWERTFSGVMLPIGHMQRVVKETVFFIPQATPTPVITGRQRITPIKDTDIIHAKKAALKDITTVAIFFIHPPGKIHQQLVDYSFQEMRVGKALLLGVYFKTSQAAQACSTGGLTSPNCRLVRADVMVDGGIKSIHFGDAPVRLPGKIVKGLIKAGGRRPQTQSRRSLRRDGTAARQRLWSLHRPN